MSNLVDFYELSLWQDVLQGDGTFKEQRLMAIGSSEMECQNRALDVRLVNGINGSHNLSFKMYYRYKDNITGEIVDNIFASYITNESKLKLYHKDKWYDLIVKTITKNSADNSFTYQAVDYHINELSKNGFGLTLDTKLENNIGTVKELGNFIMADTDWDVKADEIPQTLEESLVEVEVYPQDNKPSIAAIKIIDDNMSSESVNLNFQDGDKIYFFYSCLKNQTSRLQFIYIPKDLVLTFDQNKIITNKNCQYYIDNAAYSVDTDFSAYGLFMPNILGMTSRTITISSYRGNRYVFSKKIEYNALLDKYVTACTKGEEEWCRYEETAYEAPILVENFITNTDFASTSGWTGHYISPVDGDKITIANKQSEYGVKVEAKTDPDVVTSIIDGTYDSNTPIVPYLSATFPDVEKGVLLNSGFQNNKRKLQEIFSPGQRFVARCTFKTIEDVNSIQDIKVIIAKSAYHVMENCYTMPPAEDIYLSFELNAGDDGKAEAISEVNDNAALSEIEWQALTLQVYIQPINDNDKTKTKLFIENLEIFKHVPTGDKTYLTPDDESTEAKTITNYYYFNKLENKDCASKDQMIIYKRNTPREDIVDTIDAKAEKRVTLSVQKSNYFNAIQSLCEAAECWADFEVTHNENGEITSKKVKFKRYIGQDNYAGFRYGVNLNSISRQVVSTAIVTKLIIPDNVNQHADDGFCSIVRAKSNEIGENYIYDFSYYFHTKMLDQDTFHTKMYSTDGAKGLDVGNLAEKDIEDTNYFGYYTRLSMLNQQLDEKDAQIANYRVPLTDAKAQLKTYENSREAAEEELTRAAADFLKLTGFEYTAFEENTDEKWQDHSDVNEYLIEIATQITNIQEFSAKEDLARSSVSTYEEGIQKYTQDREKIIKQKRALNLAFYKAFARFIQEGTWQDSAAIDDEKYFIDARATAYNSSHPQVSYTINVVSLASLPGYELFDFQLGDQTWMEDEEYFGIDDNDNPIRENITITEISYALDDPSATTIKVQNFKNQFQDLFQKITASVQQVNYSSGVWDNAGSFTEADPEQQAKFLQDALNSAELVIQNAGNQSVLEDDDGITVTDLTSPNKQVRITGGAILLSDMNAGGESTWKVGLTAQGINAGIINAGTVNTNNVQIMNGNEPHFRWDSYGITAYDFKLRDNNIIDSYNPRTGIRFDRFGLYGFKNISAEDGANWHPKTLDDVREKSNFSLTWDGLEIEASNKIYNGIKHQGGLVTKLGRIDDNIYNSWDDDNLPIYDPSKKTEPTFVKVFTVGDTTGNEQLVIYDDGTLTANKIKLTQSIEWTEASSPSKSVYATSEYVNNKTLFPSIEDSVPANKTGYNTFPDRDGEIIDGKPYQGWHKVSSQNDSYYVHTDNGGATWQGPFLITGKSIDRTERKYAIARAGTEPDSDEISWIDNRPVLEETPIGYNIYTKMYNIFTNGEPSSPTYSIESGRTGSVELSKYSINIPTGADRIVPEDILQNSSIVQVFVRDGEEDVSSRSDINITWTVDGAEYDRVVSSDGSKIYLTNFEDGADAATMTVTATCGTMILGSRTCTVTKNVQGETGVWCYISSSAGNIFENITANDDRETKLIAHIIQNGTDIDPNGNKFTYAWHKEQGDNDTELEDTGKEITVSLSVLKGVRLYFKATEIITDAEAKKEE